MLAVGSGGRKGGVAGAVPVVGMPGCCWGAGEGVGVSV